MTLANRRRSRASAQRISAVRAATSPQTTSQSSGVDGYSDSVTGLLPTWPVCKSDTGHKVGCREVGGCCPCYCEAQTTQPNGWSLGAASPWLRNGLEQVLVYSVAARLRLVSSRQESSYRRGCCGRQASSACSVLLPV